jgi:GLPGLI family protein
LNILAETKTIAGYECKKAIVTMVNKDKKEEKMDVW